MSDYKKFLSEAEMISAAQNWQDKAQLKEPKKSASIYDSYVYRREDMGMEGLPNSDNIKELHGFSPIENAIQQLEAGKKKKIKILDVGGGAAIYAEQIRKKLIDQFGPQSCEVFTTGLTKKMARNSRRKFLFRINDSGSEQNAAGVEHLEVKLHQNDLKWRSILQLTDYPEFDIILDTYGEQAYGNTTNSDNRKEFLIKYTEAVCKKLLSDGGLASIWPVRELNAKIIAQTAIQFHCVAKYDASNERMIILKKEEIKEVK